MSLQMVAKVPYVQGKRSESTLELIELMGGEGLLGKDKFCISRNLPGLPGLGIMDSGAVWNGPIIDLSALAENGPTKRSLENSVLMIF